MHTSITCQATLTRARLKPTRSPMDAASVVVVLLLAALFATAIIAALQPPRLVPAPQAAIEGGL